MFDGPDRLAEVLTTRPDREMNWRQAIITTVGTNTVKVKFYTTGPELDANIPVLSGYSPFVGDTVMLLINGSDYLCAGSVGSFTKDDYLSRAQPLLMGGGIRKFTGTGISWSQRIILISNGRYDFNNVSGFFQVNMPADGTVIPGVGGHIGATVAGGAIPLTSWSALYYELPLGGAATSVPGNFRLAIYTGAHDIPPHWVRIAIRFNDVPNSVVWFDGQEDSGWINLPLASGMTPQNTTTNNPQYRFLNGIVYVAGLVILDGTGTVTIATLPVGFRPGVNHYWAGTGSAFSGFPRLLITNTGILQMQQSLGAVWHSVACNFPADI